MAQKQISYNNNFYDISYILKNINEKNVIVFLHGWGSNKEIMQQAFGKHFKHFKHLYIDMPGFGKSNVATSLKTQDYANLINIFLKTFNCEEVIIAGHSFGGKVATLIEPKMLILLSTAGILEQKSKTTILKIKISKICNQIKLNKISKLFRSKDVHKMSNIMYETFKNVVDEDFNDIFKSYKGKTIIFWGNNDTATTLISGHKIHKLISKSEFFSYKGDHYFFLEYSKKIEEKILNAIS